MGDIRLSVSIIAEGSGNFQKKPGTPVLSGKRRSHQAGGAEPVSTAAKRAKDIASSSPPMSHGKVDAKGLLSNGSLEHPADIPEAFRQQTAHEEDAEVLDMTGRQLPRNI